jgi:predicted aspartyl protease
MRHGYDTNYQPPFPALSVVLANSEEELRTAEQHALVDTGSDGTLVPMALLEDVLAPVLTETRIRSHWGEWRSVQLFVVDIELNGLTLPGIFVVGDETGDDIVLGRNLLNKLYLALDGPAQMAEVHHLKPR